MWAAIILVGFLLLTRQSNAQSAGNAGAAASNPEMAALGGAISKLTNALKNMGKGGGASGGSGGGGAHSTPGARFNIGNPSTDAGSTDISNPATGYGLDALGFATAGAGSLGDSVAQSIGDSAGQFTADTFASSSSVADYGASLSDPANYANYSDPSTAYGLDTLAGGADFTSFDPSALDAGSVDYSGSDFSGGF